MPGGYIRCGRSTACLPKRADPDAGCSRSHTVNPISMAQFWTLCLAALTAGCLAFDSAGLSVNLDGASLFIPPFFTGSLLLNASIPSDIPLVHGFTPITVIQESTLRARNISSITDGWAIHDDVFNSAFLHSMALPRVTDVIPVPEGYGTSRTRLLLPLGDPDVPSGPYFLESSTGRLCPAYRLYSDYTRSFSQSLLQKPEGTFQVLSAGVPGTASLTVAVPSRIYYTKTSDKPLAGVRIAVKDLVNIAGVRSSNGNRAWYNLYPPSDIHCARDSTTSRCRRGSSRSAETFPVRQRRKPHSRLG